MSLTIDHSLQIRVPAERVWGVIVDFDAYPEWNPFVVGCRSTLVPGDPIHMRVKGLVPFTISQRETIFDHEPGRRLSYGIRFDPLRALASERSHELVAIDGTTTEYRSHFELSGWLAPVVERLLGARLRAGFGGMSEAIRRRAEGLA